MRHSPDLIVLFEHPEWQKPLFAALDARGVNWDAYDLKSAAFDERDVPQAPLYFNQASPSAYLRGNTRAVPFALALMEDLEAQGARVLNGARAFRFELSKIAQARTLARLGIDHPRTFAFNDPAALRRYAQQMTYPAIIKPNQGGSGARMFKVNTQADIEDVFASGDDLWAPDYLMLVQEYLEHDPRAEGIVRIEIMDGEMLYAMRVQSDGGFNLCPSEVCNPGDGEDGLCAMPALGTAPPEFTAFKDVPDAAVQAALRIFEAGNLDIGGIEYLETPDGRRVFYDINANSNLRKPVAEEFGFDPFDRVAGWLEAKIASGKG